MTQFLQECDHTKKRRRRNNQASIWVGCAWCTRHRWYVLCFDSLSHGLLIIGFYVVYCGYLKIGNGKMIEAPILLKWINFNPSMDKSSYSQYSVGLITHPIQTWTVAPLKFGNGYLMKINKKKNILYNGCDYLSSNTVSLNNRYHLLLLIVLIFSMFGKSLSS